MVLEEPPLLILNDVKPVILGNPKMIVNLCAKNSHKRKAEMQHDKGFEILYTEAFKQNVLTMLSIKHTINDKSERTSSTLDLRSNKEQQSALEQSLLKRFKVT